MDRFSYQRAFSAEIYFSSYPKISSAQTRILIVLIVSSKQHLEDSLVDHDPQTAHLTRGVWRGRNDQLFFYMARRSLFLDRVRGTLCPHLPRPTSTLPERVFPGPTRPSPAIPH